jgi:toxin ParE1/3/4
MDPRGSRRSRTHRGLPLRAHTGPCRAPRALYEAPAPLLMFPNRGRLGKKEGTRELVMSPLPYIVVYTVREDTIYVVRILHGAQQWS